MTKKIISGIAILMTLVASAHGQSEVAARIDTLMGLSSSVCFSSEGLPLMNELETLSVAEKNSKAHARALECKACIYINADMHKELQTFCDSIDSHTDLRETDPYVYFYIAYTHGISYIRQNKYHLAINLAQQMYDVGKSRMSEYDKSSDEYLKYVEIYVQGIDILANAYMEIDKPEFAVAFCTESRDLCLTLDQDLISNNMLSASYTRTCAATDLYELTDGAKLLEYVEAFCGDLSLWESHASDKSYADAIIPYYTCSVEYLKEMAYIQMGDKEKAIHHYREFLRIYTENDLAQSMTINYLSANINYYKCIEDYAKCEAYADTLIKYYEDNEMTAGLVKALHSKLEANHRQRNYEQDFGIAKSIISVNDSLNALRLTTSIQEMSTLLGMDKLQIETQELKARHQKMVLLLVIGVMAAIFTTVGVWMWLKRKQERERNQMLSEQNERLETEVAKQTKELREKNDDITASINYAKRIQSAMLPDVEEFAKGHVEGAFAFYKPCEIVSGDFYWTYRRGERLTFVCSDCTGHGVPGGFLSMIGSTLLSEIFGKMENLTPGDALQTLDAELLAALDKRGDATVQDGMDLALVTLDKETETISFAAARRPVFVVHDGELTEYKGTKRSIGDRDETSRSLAFETMTIPVGKGDTIYICSDGLADQFGGQTAEAPKGKRLKSGGLKRILLQVSELPIAQQQRALNIFFAQWKGSCYQVDDVSLIGIRI